MSSITSRARVLAATLTLTAAALTLTACGQGTARPYQAPDGPVGTVVSHYSAQGTCSSVAGATCTRKYRIRVKPKLRHGRRVVEIAVTADQAHACADTEPYPACLTD